MDIDPPLRAENAIRQNMESNELYKPRLLRFTYAEADGFGYDPWFFGAGDNR